MNKLNMDKPEKDQMKRQKKEKTKTISCNKKKL